MGDSVTFYASGDVNDIGVTLSIELDGDAADSTTGGSAQLDSHSISFGGVQDIQCAVTVEVQQWVQLTM